ncbi:Alg9-like mannosyltransferase family-domain-containing protein [Phlyctochytrium arcticum]|nr:Alg9-like mannosyltransferase family-domain-containing protein [Phlyctochytrium arcticum]
MKTQNQSSSPEFVDRLSPLPRIIILGLFIFRLANAFLVQTYYDPDEYWQGPEVAHYMVFGYPFQIHGYLTWEWREQIRGILHPLVFATAFKLLEILGLGGSDIVVYAPRVIQAGFSCLTDVYTYYVARRLYGKITASRALTLSVVSWYNFFCGVRTFSNSLEVPLQMMALYYWPLNPGKATKSILALGIAAVACITRPTSAITWVYLACRTMSLGTVRQNTSFLAQALMVGAGAMILSVGIDYLFFGKWTIVLLNFLRWNLAKNISIFYGSHPWHWYLTQGLPLVTITQLPLLLLHVFRQPRRTSADRFLENLMIWVIGVYSLMAHKEFRFIFPVVPLMNIRAASAASSLYAGLSKGVKQIVIGAIVLINVLLALYLSMVHQRGVVDAMHWLRREVDAGRVRDAVVLMPCHSTPFYSVLHRDIPLRFLTCEPPNDMTSTESGQTYQDEADVFYNDPAAFSERYFQTSGPTEWKSVPGQNYALETYNFPTHLIVFENLIKQLPNDTFAQYSECSRFFNSHFIDDSRRVGDVVIYCTPKS